MAPKPDSTPVWDDESFAAMVSWPLVLSPFGLLAPQTNNSNNSKSNKDEASVLRSASILLAAGAILELPLAALARANARPALARLLECYEASQAYFVLSRAGKNSNNKNSNSNNNNKKKKNSNTNFCPLLTLSALGAGEQFQASPRSRRSFFCLTIPTICRFLRLLPLPN